MKKIFKGLSILSLLFVFFFTGVGFFSQPASAAGTSEYRLQISPPQADLGQLIPGKTYNGSFKVQNVGTKPYKFTAEVVPYSVSDTDYDPLFDYQSDRTLMTEWTTFSYDTDTVEPNSSVEVKYTVKVPANAPAGNQNAAIAVTMDVEPGAGVTTLQRVAFIMFSNVEGETIKKGSVIDNKVPGFVFSAPLKVTSTVRNDGNVYVPATYLLEVRNFFNNSLEYSNSFYRDGKEVVPNFVIFPETSRYTEVTWDNAPMVGIFKVKSEVKILDEVSTVEKTVIVCPLWLIVVIVLFIGLAIFWIVSRIMKRRD